MFSTSWRALGTTVVVGARSHTALHAARDAVAGEVAALDLACSRFRDDSELARLNAASGAPVVVGELLAQAIRVALRAAALTDGDVDPTVGAAMRAIGYDSDFTLVAADGQDDITAAPAPGWRVVSIGTEPAVVTLPPGVSLDLGATAKALGADRAAAAAAAACGQGVVVSLGGDVAVAGDAPAEGWFVDVMDDASAGPDAPRQRVAIRAGGLATSSTTVRHWRRGGLSLHHVVAPRSGMPAQSPFRTISVAAATCVDANTATTAALVRGDAATAWLQATGLPARLVTHSGRVIVLNGWPAGADLAA